VIEKVAGGVGSGMMRYGLRTPGKKSASAVVNRKDTLFAFKIIIGMQFSIF
jgi:hypothetical protein